MVSKGWFTNPIASLNQDVCKVDQSFLDYMKQCSKKDDVWKFFWKLPMKRKSRRIKNWTRLNGTSIRVQRTCNGCHGKKKSPDFFTSGTGSALLVNRDWFTDAHIEDCGNKLISHNPIGQKIFLNAARGTNLFNFFKITVTVKDFAGDAARHNAKTNKLSGSNDPRCSYTFGATWVFVPLRSHPLQ